MESDREVQKRLWRQRKKEDVAHGLQARRGKKSRRLRKGLWRSFSSIPHPVSVTVTVTVTARVTVRIEYCHPLIV